MQTPATPAPRDHWSSRLGFVLAAAGSAIGLGNLWKFPYITWDNRGGAFVLVYLGCIAAVGLPIMIAEILIGRKTQKSVVGALKEALGPAWRVVGWLGVATGWILLGYYTVVAGWTLSYLARCLRWSFTGFPAGHDPGAAFGALVGDGPVQLVLAAAFMALTVAVVYSGVGHGIERVNRVLMPALLAILALLLVTALAMDGAGEALSFIFRPSFGELSWDGALEALGHSFFTLSLGMGAMITYGSYLRRGESVVRSGAWVVALDTLIAVMATVIMFSVIFSVPGMSDHVGRSTAGMLFISLPELFYTAVPFGALLAPLFYLLVAFAALTSTISMLEVAVSYWIDERGVDRKRATLLCGAGIFGITALSGLSFGTWGTVSNFVVFGEKAGLFATLDHLVANWLLPVGGLAIVLGTGWVMSREAARAELVDGTQPRWFRYGLWRFFIRFVSPLAVAAILLAVIFFGRDFS